MQIIPAIDIIDGKCVRLSKGDYSQKTIYNEHPLEVAKRFEDAGLQRLHLVDLDGAKAGAVKNWKVLEQVAGKAVRARVRFERDERIAGIVANWPTGASAERAARLGLKADIAFADIVRQYIADCRQRPDAAQTLKGLNA